ncbi:TPA: hypothetical protein ACGWRE_004625 [Salmonella enterica]
MRDALKLADEATITARMNAIPHSNYRAVVFTKEQYARIPLRDDTVDEHAQDMLYDFVAAGRVASAMDSDSHRKEAARRRVARRQTPEAICSQSCSARRWYFLFWFLVGQCR